MAYWLQELQHWLATRHFRCNHACQTIRNHVSMSVIPNNQGVHAMLVWLIALGVAIVALVIGLFWLESVEDNW